MEQKDIKNIADVVESGYVGYTTQYDKTTTAGTEYFGFAPCGSATTAAVWYVKKVVTSEAGDIVTTWANAGTGNVAWSGRASLSYS